MTNLSHTMCNSGETVRKKSGKWLHGMSAVLTAVLLAFAILILPGTLPDQQSSIYGPALTVEAKSTQYYAASQVNVRAKATSKSDKLGSFSAGDPVDVQSISNGWAKIDYDGSTAYVSAKYLTTSSGTKSSSRSANVSGAGGSSGGTVWISETGSKYHRINNCGRMNPNKAHKETEDQAIAEGYTPCKKCW